MDWVERRFLFEKNLISAWAAIKVQIESSAQTFDKRYNHSQQTQIACEIQGSCVMVTHDPIDGPVRRSIHICLDPKGKRLFSRSEDGVEKDVLYFGFDAAGNAHIVDTNSVVLDQDRVAQYFLESFLFPDSRPSDHVRFPIDPLASATAA